MNGKKIVLPSHFENGDVNVIDAWRLRIHRRPVECPAVQGIVRDYPVIALIAIVQRRQKRGRAQDDNQRDDNNGDPARLATGHRADFDFSMASLWVVGRRTVKNALKRPANVINLSLVWLDRDVELDSRNHLFEWKRL